MDPEQFRALLAKYNNNAATAEERALVEHWYEQLHEDRFLPGATNLKDQLYSRVKKHISENESAPAKPIKFRKLYQWIAAAAILCVLFNIWLLYFNKVTDSSIHQDTNLAHSGHNNTITPGTNKAILTLADGSKISLSDAGNGRLAQQAGVVVTKTKNGGLIYKVIGQSCQREI